MHVLGLQEGLVVRYSCKSQLDSAHCTNWIHDFDEQGKAALCVSILVVQNDLYVSTSFSHHITVTYSRFPTHLERAFLDL